MYQSKPTLNPVVIACLNTVLNLTVDFPKANIAVRGRESDDRTWSFYSTWTKLVSFIPVPQITWWLMADKEPWQRNLPPTETPDEVGFVSEAPAGKGRTKCSSAGMARLREVSVPVSHWALDRAGNNHSTQHRAQAPTAWNSSTVAALSTLKKSVDFKINLFHL